jgi:uncharacterized protein (DUF2252 family)
LAVAQRYEEGVGLRRKTSRKKHADLLGPIDRDPLAILARGDRTRVPELVPVRYERMLTSQFAFLRGAAAVMAEDLRHQPTAGIAVQACGDCHLMNFGAFATPEENTLFYINDFDEMLPGVDFTADLRRLDDNFPHLVAGKWARMVDNAVRTQKDYDQLVKAKRNAAKQR